MGKKTNMVTELLFLMLEDILPNYFGIGNCFNSTERLVCVVWSSPALAARLHAAEERGWAGSLHGHLLLNLWNQITRTTAAYRCRIIQVRRDLGRSTNTTPRSNQGHLNQLSALGSHQ